MSRGDVMRCAAVSLALLLGAPARGQQETPLEIPVGGGPVAVGAVPEGIDAVDAAACGQCHESAYAQWSESRHRSAYTDPIFRHELAVVDERAACVGCHAPRVARRNDGVDCATCHVRDGFVLNPRVSGRAPHASRVSRELSRTRACARCHDFSLRGDPIQTTVHEWRRSEAAAEGRTCQSCHFPATREGHDHGLHGVDNPDALASALTVSARARRTARGTHVALRLRANDVGHAVPTGDLFRTLEVSAWIEGRGEEPSTMRFGRRRTPNGFVDTRIAPPPSRGRIARFSLPPGARVHYRVDLLLMRPDDARHSLITGSDIRRAVASGSVDVEETSLAIP